MPLLSEKERKGKTKESPPNFIWIPPLERSPKIVDKTLERKRVHTGSTSADKESVSQPRLGLGSRLHKGKVLAPLTCMVLHGNHLGCLRMWVFISLISIYSYLQKECEGKGFGFFLLLC